MHEHPPSWFSLRRVLGSTLLFVAGLIFGVALCKEFWPTIQEREVPVVSYIDRRVEVPVEKIVERILEKRVEVPVVKEVIRYVDRPVVAAPAPAADGHSRYELEDWAKLRRKMNRAGPPRRPSRRHRFRSGSLEFSFQRKGDFWQRR